MVYNIKKSNGQPLVSIPDSTQDTTSTSLTLPGRNSLNFGLSIDQNFVDLLQNFAANSPPPSPQQGQLWYDAANLYLKIYDGSRWVQVMPSFDGAGGTTTEKIGINAVDCTIIISEYQIVMVVSADRVEPADCPDSIIFNDTAYSFAARYPNGLYPGINLATDPQGQVTYVLNGISTYANVLTTARTISINGSTVGNFKFDGSANVNVTVNDSNVYVVNAAGYTTNVTVAGTWTKVLVSDGGRVLEGNNIAASDVVAALGFTPYDGANISVDAVANTIVGRDANANFAANVIVARSLLIQDIEATGSIGAPEFIGTATNAAVLQTERNIYVNGDIYGNVMFDGSKDVVLTSNLATYGNLASTFNLVYVDNKGRVTKGIYESQIPLGAIMLFSDQFTPNGWAPCDGKIYTGSSGAYASPNLVNAGQDISAGTGQTLQYLIHYDAVPQTYLTPGSPDPTPTIIINGTTPVGVPSATTVSASLSGGPSQELITPGFGNIDVRTVGALAFNPGLQFANTSFMDTEYFDSIALIMGLGDYNGIMFSRNDAWKNLASLTVTDIKNNLLTRASRNLPPAVGKYMLPYKLIDQQSVNLSIPSDFAFSPLLQDQLISSITSNFAHQLAISGIVPSDSNLFGCHYLGSADAYVKVLKSAATEKVSNVLINSGYYVTTTSHLDQYTRNSFIKIMAQILQIAKEEIQWRNANNQNVIVSGQDMSTSNANIIVNTAAVDGIKVGNNDYVDLGGGYFPEYDTTNVETSGATVSGTTELGSAGTVSMELHDAGAAALAAVLETSPSNDQAGLSQLIVNRTGYSASGTASYGGTTGFDIATVVGAFSALSAALYGPNSNSAASALYGALFVDKTALKEALSKPNADDMMAALSELFKGTLTISQLTRIKTLRDQVFRNGSEMKMAQVAIGSAVNYLPPGSNSATTKKPFGDQATEYSLLAPGSGFYVPNFSDNSTLAPAPSPDALLRRLIANKVDRTPPGSIVFDVPGTYSFILPDNNGKVTINVWGGGGASAHRSIAPSIYNGGTSSVAWGTYTLTAGGGVGGGLGARRYCGPGGPGGQASGGDINENGKPGIGNGYYNSASLNGGNAGGQAYGGGSGGEGGAANWYYGKPNYSMGDPGTAPGGGAGGIYYYDYSKKPGFVGFGGAGGGAFVQATNRIIAGGTEFIVVVGAGGQGDVNGAPGKVTITWT